MTYRAPVADIAFALRHAARFTAARAEGVYDLDDDVLAAVLEEAGKFASDVIAPLNRVGDLHGTPFRDGVVTTPPGWKEAYLATIKDINLDGGRAKAEGAVVLDSNSNSLSVLVVFDGIPGGGPRQYSVPLQ
jgi:hypothetical protein